MTDDVARQRIMGTVDEQRLVSLLVDAIDVPSPTGQEQAMAAFIGGSMRDAGLTVRLQEVEEGRANAVGSLEGASRGPTLMFNGHIDTSYSGDEPWLTGIGYKPEATLRDGLVYGLGAANMKSAVCCYVEAIHALRDAGVRLAGDVVIAAVAGEIEKAQWPGDDRFVGKSFRGYSSGTRFLVTHGGVADMCVIGEPTDHSIVKAHYGTCWVRISTTGPFVHTAFSVGRLEENSIVRMNHVLDAVLSWIPGWEAETEYLGEPGIVNIGALTAGHPWRLSRTPARADLFLDVRIPPTMTTPTARAAVRDLIADLRQRFPEHGIDWELYVTVPGAEIPAEHPVIDAVEAAHADVLGGPAEHRTVRWGSDASVLNLYGIPTVNYGTSSGLPGPEGENARIDQLVALARVYALTAASICGTA